MRTKELVKFPIESAKLEWSELALRAEGMEYFISARVIGDEDKKILLMHLYSQKSSGTETHKQITECSSIKKIISHRICNVKRQNG